MKFLTKLTVTVLILMTIMTMILPTSAMAASKTYKGSSSCTYTITTGKKDATLTLKPYKGKRAQKYVKKKNSKKTHIEKWNAYATYSVTVDGETYTVSNKKVKVTLPANGTYKVSVECTGAYWQDEIEPSFDPLGLSYGKSGDRYWHTKPSIKLDVNNWAKIKKN